VCRCRFMVVVSSCPACWALDSHNRWTTMRGPRHRQCDAAILRNGSCCEALDSATSLTHSPAITLISGIVSR
jgi:hypothetical protein